MATFHKRLTHEKWQALPRARQILNIASELHRARGWCADRVDYCSRSLERALELLDMSINDRASWQGTRLHELLRFREVVAGLYDSGNFEESFLSSLITTLLHLDRESAALRLS